MFMLKHSQSTDKVSEICIAVALEMVSVEGTSNFFFIQCYFNTPTTEKWAFKSPPFETGQACNSPVTT